MPPRLHCPRPRGCHTQPSLQMDPGSLGDHLSRPRPLPRVRRGLRANGVIAILTPEPGGVAQSAEAADLKSVQCGFESHRPYYQKLSICRRNSRAKTSPDMMVRAIYCNRTATRYPRAFSMATAVWSPIPGST